MARPTKLSTREHELVIAPYAQFAKRRSDWQENHNKIRKAVMTHWASNKSMASHKEIARITGLGEDTISKHLSETTFDVVKEELREQASLLVQPVLFGLYNGAMKGSAECAKVLLKIGADFDAKAPDNIQQVNIQNNIASLTPEEIATAQEQLMKLARRVERDKELGINE